MEDNKKQDNKTIIGGAKVYKDYTFAVGRRRAAVARIRVYLKIPSGLKFGENEVKKGEILVNERKIESYFSGVVSKAEYEKPLKIINATQKYAVTARIVGGGTSSQIGAFVLGLSRALSTIDEENRPLLRKKGLLTRDARVRERRKVGMGGKSRRKRQSPKR